MSKPSRTEQRRHWDTQVRIGLLEQDGDTFEHAIRELGDRMERGLRNTQRILIALLGTVAGSAVVHALLFQAGGS